MKNKKLCKYVLILVYKLDEIFQNINTILNEQISLIAMIISTDILIKKRISPTEEIKLLSCTIADDKGSISAIVKNENIGHIKIGTEVILRNVKVDIINGYIVLICDENTAIYDNKQKRILCPNTIINISKIKINKIDYEII